MNAAESAYDAAGHTTGYASLAFTYNDRGRLAAANTTDYLYNALGQMIEKSGSAGTTVFVQDESGHLLGEYNGSGQLIEETVWLGDIPVATLQPNGSGGVTTFYVHSDHLNTPRKVAQPTTGTLAWRWDADPFGTAAPNQNPAGLGTFSYNLRFPGQYYDAETELNQNVNRDYDPLTGKYVESDPVGLKGGINTYAYVDSNPVWFFDPDGRGKEGGQKNIGGDDPAMPKGVTPNSPQAVKDAAIRDAEKALKETGINPARAKKLKAYIKVLSRKAPKGMCPPLLEELAIATARQLCEAGDQNMCQVFLMLGGEIDVPGT